MLNLRLPIDERVARREDAEEDMGTSQTGSADQGATVVITHRVRQDKHVDYEAWLGFSTYLRFYKWRNYGKRSARGV